MSRVDDGPLRLGVDATPLLGQRSGVGRHLVGLLDALARTPGAPAPVLTLFSLRGRLPEPLPPGARPAPRRAPARLLHPAWRYLTFPPVEMLTGPLDVFHAPNFVLPPARCAGTVTVHDLAFLHHAGTVDKAVLAYRHLVPASVRRADAVMVVSEAIRKEVCADLPVDPAQVHVAPNGVDPVWLAAPIPTAADRRRIGLPEDYVLFVGNAEPRKGLDVLALAHRHARAQDPSVPPLVVVGPPGWGDAWGDADPDPRDVIRLGYLADTDLRATVAGARAVCLPSRYEGFGLPVLEALAAGTPAIASDIAAHREVAGGHARLVAPGDVDAWADALVNAQGGPAEQRRAGQRWASGWTWDRSAATHLAVWRAVAQ